MHRRRFLQCLAAASMTPVATGCSRAANTGGSASLVPDPDQILDLPAGFSYRIVSMAGTRMSDGLVVPGRHDGMAAFDDGDGRIRLVCNHECNPAQVDISAFPQGPGDLSEEMLARFYDRGQDRTPGVGGTTTTIYNPASGETERQFMSLAGTEINCAGGPTPWGSWLSCEECFTEPGSNTVGATRVFRDQHHGYIFEVPASSDGLVEPVPLKAMGRFEHEACAVVGDAIYMTEDRFHSLFYRFLPTETGNLAAGGRLQALAVKDRPSLQTHNWSNAAGISIGSELETHWIDIRDPDPSRNDVRLLGAAQGAATFARGEGLCVAGDGVAFSCTIGGPARLGQVFTYTPSPYEGTDREKEAPGRLSLLAESSEDSILRNADNMTAAPWGDLIICEDTSGQCGMVGVRPDGEQYRIALAAYSTSEMAGVCFSPDGETLFVNIQVPGMTVAVTGPWETLAG